MGPWWFPIKEVGLVPCLGVRQASGYDFAVEDDRQKTVVGLYNLYRHFEL